MAVVKGQPKLLRTLETIVKAAETRQRRAKKRGASSSTEHNNLNMVFYGPPGTGKTSTVKVLAEVFTAQEVRLLESSKVTELNRETGIKNLIGGGSSSLPVSTLLSKSASSSSRVKAPPSSWTRCTSAAKTLPRRFFHCFPSTRDV